LKRRAVGKMFGMGKTRNRICSAGALTLAALGAGLAGAPPASADAAPPSCAEGPRREGDVLVGTDCGDRIVVPAGVARVEGGPGDDVLIAPRSAADGSCPAGCHLGVGSQVFEGGPGNDIVYGERGNDILRGGEGDDRLYGGIGDDLLQGGPGNDFLSGGFGADAIDGEAGSDFARGDPTQDEIVDSGPASDTDTLSFGSGATPGFPNNSEYPNFAAHAGFPGPKGERGVYLNLATNVADNGTAPDAGGVDQIEGADFERVIGTPFSDYIVGARPGLEIWGGGGADVLIAEGPGERLDGGADGDDCVGAAVAVSCESEAANGPVVPREAAKSEVGFVVPPAEVGEAEIYVAGSSAGETLTATYAAGPPVSVSFALSGASFDQSAAASAGCSVSSASEATCTLPGALDTALLAGLGGGDTLRAVGFPDSVELYELGGDGDDTLTGGDATEDVLADGPGDDVLSSLGGDDAVLNNEGSDRVEAGAGNDLLLSNSICDGDLLDGGEGRDNASWAKFKSGVEARIGAGDAGRPGPGGAPECAGGSLDTLESVEDLEGSGSDDTLIGGPQSNQLLGHSGADTYFAEGGDDTILANSADFDPTIDCGADDDLAVIDFAQYGEIASADCETVLEAAPNSFRGDAELPPEVAPKPLPEPAPPSNRFRFARLTRDSRRGTGTLFLRVPGPGRVSLRGPRVLSAARAVARASTVALTVRPRPALTRAMRRGQLRARVKVTVTFAPPDAKPRTKPKTLTLIRRPSPRRVLG
jgi:Ca2+-binding RTX toxin-like protein